MSATIWVFTLINVLYSTGVIGLIVWYKMHRLREQIKEEYNELKQSLPPVIAGEWLVKEQVDGTEQTLREYNARLTEIERQLEQHWGDGKGSA